MLHQFTASNALLRALHSPPPIAPVRSASAKSPISKALERATERGDLAAMHQLLAAGVSDKGKSRALCIAVWNRNLEAARLLLQAGANPDRARRHAAAGFAVPCARARTAAAVARLLCRALLRMWSASSARPRQMSPALLVTRCQAQRTIGSYTQKSRPRTAFLLRAHQVSRKESRKNA